ncbi:YhcH/YjgK/YiaL family protein [Chitinophaga sp. sic0106]|uniref:YhcH/YjgK/YiaL family protein n=1 Tax=Chitinophaga sp. sic0106 TaxID=2854785 RepID=UPI001C463FD7|nr:YhcH/YjgK/YiaL family protein [Chitinophaga sp. sic0106]MBV7530061.1 YhcH/YjgK/YiaL family protein [Chitinophaga sp. sic0106]
MIVDTLDRAARYHVLGEKFVKAFDYLRQTDFTTIAKGKYDIDGTNIFAIVNEYDTIAEEGEQMEAHRKYIDVQYLAAGEERIGHDFLGDKNPSKAYSDTEDYMLFAEKPAFYTVLKQGQFAIFFPTDLHMPNLRVAGPVPVKKVVIKIAVD